MNSAFYGNQLQKKNSTFANTWNGSLTEKHCTLGCSWSHTSFPQHYFTTEAASPLCFYQEHWTPLHFPDKKRGFNCPYIVFPQKDPAGLPKMDIWKDGLMVFSSTLVGGPQGMDWEAWCCTGWAGLRCLNKYEGKDSFVGDSYRCIRWEQTAPPNGKAVTTCGHASHNAKHLDSKQGWDRGSFLTLAHLGLLQSTYSASTFYYYLPTLG